MAYYHRNSSFNNTPWWEQTPTKYNKDGTVYRRPEGKPGKFYNRFALEPTSPGWKGVFEILIGVISFIGIGIGILLIAWMIGIIPPA